MLYAPQHRYVMQRKEIYNPIQTTFLVIGRWLNVSGVCRRWYGCASDHSLWAALVSLMCRLFCAKTDWKWRKQLIMFQCECETILEVYRPVTFTYLHLIHLLETSLCFQTQVLCLDTFFPLQHFLEVFELGVCCKARRGWRVGCHGDRLGCCGTTRPGGRGAGCCSCSSSGAHLD